MGRKTVHPNAGEESPDTGIRISGLGTAISFFGVDQIVVTPNGRSLLVHTPGTVTVIDTDTNSITGNIPLAGDFEGGGIGAIP